MTQRDVDAFAGLEAETRRVAARISEDHQSVLSTLDPSLHQKDMRSTSLQRLSAVVMLYVMGLVVPESPAALRLVGHELGFETH